MRNRCGEKSLKVEQSLLVFRTSTSVLVTSGEGGSRQTAPEGKEEGEEEEE